MPISNYNNAAAYAAGILKPCERAISDVSVINQK